MTLSEKQRKFTRMAAELVVWAYDNGFELTYGHAWRDAETQRMLIEKGLSRTMNSRHCERCAVDFNLYRNGVYVKDSVLYRPLGERWETLGGRWGGRFGVEEKDYGAKVGWDANHFEHAG